MNDPLQTPRTAERFALDADGYVLGYTAQGQHDMTRFRVLPDGAAELVVGFRKFSLTTMFGKIRIKEVQSDLYTIDLNGEERQVNGEFLSYEKVLGLCGVPENKVLTVTYDHAEWPKPCGTLIRGQKIKLGDKKVHINACDTSNA